MGGSDFDWTVVWWTGPRGGMQVVIQHPPGPVPSRTAALQVHFPLSILKFDFECRFLWAAVHWKVGPRLAGGWKRARLGQLRHFCTVFAPIIQRISGNQRRPCECWVEHNSLSIFPRLSSCRCTLHAARCTLQVSHDVLSNVGGFSRAERLPFSFLIRPCLCAIVCSGRVSYSNSLVCYGNAVYVQYRRFLF